MNDKIVGTERRAGTKLRNRISQSHRDFESKFCDQEHFTAPNNV